METSNIKTIDEVVLALDTIISTTETEKSTLGYFAALYRKVTLRVKEGVKKKEFEDNKRMETLDVVFATRYIEAYNAYKTDQTLTKSWWVAFKLSTKFYPTVLQHLLIGMNAHINLDLGIAAAQVMKGKNIEDLEGDFNKINEILASLVAGVEKDLSEIWPTLKYLLKLTKSVDDFLINFAMGKARAGAWKFAVSLSGLQNDADLQKAIAVRDGKVAKIGRLVTHPGKIASLVLWIVRLGEKGTVQQKTKKMLN